ncbi:MAG TPA: pilus assembly protein TadG-related protein [Gaiellales bacterium]|nr:pilus assembly protein TadG-related protein [Gaiellales bacterium]
MDIRFCRDERGQTLALFVVFLMSLLGMAAFAIDVGSWYQDKRHLQADADAAALAGAAGLRTGSAVSTATANFNTNKLSGETVNVAMPAYDTVRVTTTYQAPAFFAKLFGHASTTVTATATAKIQGIGSAQHHVSPYVVTVASYNNGQGTTLFNCDASGNCGTVDLPTADNTSGGSCSGNVYTGISQNVLSAITDQIDIGELDIGGCLSPKTGNAQPSANSVNTLAGSMSQDLQSLGNGQYTLIHQSWDDAQGLPPRLIFVPIVQNFATGTNANMTILSFAWFYITSATGSGQTLKINGQYVSMTMTATSKAVAWQPSQTGQITFVSLTG